MSAIRFFRQSTFSAIGWIPVFLALVCHFASTCPAQSTDNSTLGGEAESTHFVILKTGSVFSGLVEQQDDQVRVHTDTGAVVRLNVTEIDFVSSSMDEAAERLFARIPQGALSAHAQLADWCVRNGAWTFAGQQIDRLERGGHGEAEIRLFRQRLETALQIRKSLHLDEPVAMEETATEKSAAPVRALPVLGAMASHEQLRAAVESLAPPVRREFTSSVHNRVLTGCAAARCHGSPDDSFRLWKYGTDGGLDSTAAQRNLHAMLQWIDRDEPSQSLFLQYLSRPHADMTAPPFEVDSPEWVAIRNWVLATASPEPSRSPVVAASGELEDTAPRPADLMGAAAAKSQPIGDPYDPAEFNRLHARPPSRDTGELRKSSRPLPPVVDDHR